MKHLIYSALFLIFVLIFPIFGQSLACICASDDANHLVKEDNKKVKQYNFLLNNLSKKFIENQTQIVDITKEAIDDLYKVGIHESLFSVMETVNKNSYFSNSKQSYASFIFAMVLLITSW